MSIQDLRPLLVIISGPSGVGKDAILIRMKETGLPYYYSVTATSRPQRLGEVDGVDYHFIDRVEFEKMIANGEFLEWANVYGNLYGVPRKTVKEALVDGKDVIVKVDVQGATTIKRLEPEAVSIFITPPTMKELERRLIARKTETESNLERRLKTAREEMQSQYSFDHVIVSRRNQIDSAIAEIENTIQKEKERRRLIAEASGSSARSHDEKSKMDTKKTALPRSGREVVRIPHKHNRRIRLPRTIRKIGFWFKRRK